MGTFRRYRTALSRHHRSRGFGIHSPHAFKFVRWVLRERLPYYSYPAIESIHKAVASMSGSRWRRKADISLSNAKMLFRITNYANPSAMLQVGAGSGLASSCMLAVNSRSAITLCDPQPTSHPAAQRVLEPWGNRITCRDNIAAAIMHYRKNQENAGGNPFVLIDHLPSGTDSNALLAYLNEILAGTAVVVMRNLNNDSALNDLWLQCKHAMPMGQTFNNEKIAILIASPKLQREDFFLWL